MTMPQAFSATARTVPVPFHALSAQVVQVAQHGCAVRSAYHLSIRFEEPWHPMCSLAKRPRTSRLHKNLAQKEIPYRAIEESDYGFMIRRHEPFFRNDRTRFAISLIYMSSASHGILPPTSRRTGVASGKSGGNAISIWKRSSTSLPLSQFVFRDHIGFIVRWTTLTGRAME